MTLGGALYCLATHVRRILGTTESVGMSTLRLFQSYRFHEAPEAPIIETLKKIRDMFGESLA